LPKLARALEETNRETQQLDDDYLPIPADVSPLILSSIPYVVTLQLFAYYMAVAQSVNPNKPRNLAKSITVL
jgi:glucosamine--fructose-6-phosphate aminotransferase (isomerizing)